MAIDSGKSGFPFQYSLFAGYRSAASHGLSLMAPAIRIGLVAVLVFALGAVSYFATIENVPLPYHPLIDGWNDTILHVGAFAVLTFIALLIWRPSLGLVLSLLLFGVLIEIVQLGSDGREADLLDIAADAIGVFAAHVAYYALRWLKSVKIDTLAGMRK